MWRHIASNGVTFLIVALFLLGGVIIWGQDQYKSAGPLEQPICFKVDRGTNMTRVSDALAGEGAISNPSIFRIGADYEDKSTQLKAGSYLVPQGTSMQEIVTIITQGGASTCGTEVVYRIGVTRATVQVRELDPATNRFVERVAFNPAEDEIPSLYTNVKAEGDTRFRISLAEGVTSWQVVQELNQVDVLDGTLTDIPTEGSLAPDSYEVRQGDSRASLIDRMATAQTQRIEQVWAERREGLPISTREEMLILASIIEKETGVPQERRQVASVFTNRLEQGIRLQTDPTVIYGVTKGQGVLGRGLRQSELRRETPWNTYVIDGLPPTPIANPGLASLRAAIDPDDTPFIFFVADGTGGHAFAVTLAEHNANVARWRRIESERSDN